DASLVTDVIDNLFALRLFLIHNRLSPLPEPLPCNSGGLPAPCGFFFIGRPSVRAVSRLSDLPSPRCNRVSTQRPTE
ncbi:TPA: hypothetical protein ACKLRY_002204, partial [Neisseria gonorrhoeae]